MNVVTAAAAVFAAISLGAIGFQLGLALGAPWGALAMGGKYPGRFPPAMRVAALVQALVIAALGGIVVARAGLALTSWDAASRWAIWVVVTFSALSLVLNAVTPSALERRIWAPVAFGLLATSLTVAVLA